ncbi:bifunctional metallophosphatase/5'-nucleotidase [Streptomyces sp. NBC_01429]|uniref:bifunctional metallophosphatase/5'-nucleotidase n=1 Tax=Streptomyces sp. NBC_01429 TaxID=2903862 RepID=UPI002E295A86|nr:bifunctional metallophosphatase/5'-nucleotidase [Streptomyces sp. NBC_01429]
MTNTRLPRLRSRGALAAGVLAATTALLGFQTAPTQARAPERVPVQLLALNDLHGNLEPVDGAAGRITHRGTTLQAGGLAQMATLLDEARAGQTNTLTVAGGDMIGGSPLLSAIFHDEPTVAALDELGVVASSVGNHEFDEGPQELRRVIEGGCHAQDGCAPDAPYAGAGFAYLGGNVTARGSDTPLLRPYKVETLPTGQKIGFIGVVTKNAPTVINASMVRELEFHDELPAIEKYSKELTKQGVRAQVLLIHEGETVNGTAGADCDEGGPGAKLNGRIKEISQKAPTAIGLVVSGHSHDSYECAVLDPANKRRVVTQADSFGRSFTDLRFDLNARGEILRSTVRAQHRAVPVATTQQPAMSKLIGTWRGRSEEQANRVVGHIAGDLPGRGSTDPETPLGSLITDAQAAAGRGYGADFALTNPGSMRADIIYRDGGVVTYADAYRVQPFANALWVLPITGQQLVTALKQQLGGANEASPRFLQLSKELSYSVDMSRSGADRLLVDTIRLKGRPLDPAATYKVTVNDFLANGGNDFDVFGEIATREGGDITDLDALVTYLEETTSAGNPAPVPAQGRITFVTP